MNFDLKYSKEFQKEADEMREKIEDERRVTETSRKITRFQDEDTGESKNES